MQVTWDDGTVEDVEVATPSTETVTWDDDGTTEEVNIGSSNTIDTSNMGMGETDEDTGVYTPSINEEGGGTASPQDLQWEQDRQKLADMGDDIESVTGATRSAWQGLTGAKENKRDREIARVLKEKHGATVQKTPDGKKYLVMEDGRHIEYPEDGNILETFNAMRDEMGGAVAGGLVGGMVGSAVPVVGTAVGAAIGSGLGAYYGAGVDIDRNADKTGVEVTPEERATMQKHAGLTDLAGSALISSIGKIIGKEAIKDFTSIANLPKKQREAILYLAKKSDLTEEQMNKKILDYGKSTDRGLVSETSAIEGAAKASEREQTGIMSEAMRQSDSGKGNVIAESTKRTEVVESALKQLDEEFETDSFTKMLQRYTLDDEGRRKATDWRGLERAMRTFGIDETDPIYQRVAENAKTFGSKETDIFQSTVKPMKPEDKAIKAVQPFTETTRASMKSQIGATGIGFVDRILSTILPGIDKRTVNLVKKAMQEVKTPKELEQRLIDEGIDSMVAKQVATAHEKALVENAAVDAKRLKEVEKAEREAIKKATAKKKVWDKASTEPKSSMEAGIDKDVKEFKKKSTALKKEKKTKNAELDKRAKEDLADYKKKVIREHEDETAKWEDTNKVSSKQYNLLKKRYKESIGTMEESAEKAKLDEFRAKMEFDNSVDELAEKEAKDKDNILVPKEKPYKPMSENAKNKIVKEDNTGTRESSVDINSRQGDEYTPVEDPHKALYEKEQKDKMQDLVKTNKRARDAKRKEVDRADEINIIEDVTSGRAVKDTPEDRKALNLTLNHPDATDAQRKIAKEHLDKFNDVLHSANKDAVSSAVKKAKLNNEYGLYDVGGGRDKYKGFGDFIIGEKVDKKKAKAYLDNHPNPDSKINQRIKKYIDGEEVVPKKRSSSMEAGIRKTPTETDLDRSAEVLKKHPETLKLFTDATNALIGKSGKKKPSAIAARNLYRDGELTKTQVMGIFDGKVPYEITRGKENW